MLNAARFLGLVILLQGCSAPSPGDSASSGALGAQDPIDVTIHVFTATAPASDGSPLSGQTVAISGDHGTITAVLDGNGSTVQGLSPGTYTVDTSPASTYDVAAGDGSLATQHTLTVDAGGTTQFGYFLPDICYDCAAAGQICQADGQGYGACFNADGTTPATDPGTDPGTPPANTCGNVDPALGACSDDESALLTCVDGALQSQPCDSGCTYYDDGSAGCI